MTKAMTTPTHPQPTPEQLFLKAIEIAGSQGRLAKAIGFSQPAISKARKFGKASAEMAAAIDKFTNGKVPKHALRPDLWKQPEP